MSVARGITLLWPGAAPNRSSPTLPPSKERFSPPSTRKVPKLDDIPRTMVLYYICIGQAECRVGLVFQFYLSAFQSFFSSLVLFLSFVIWCVITKIIAFILFIRFYLINNIRCFRCEDSIEMSSGKVESLKLFEDSM